MENHFPIEILQPVDAIHRANQAAFALRKPTDDENLNGCYADYRFATNQDDIPEYWYYNIITGTYERYDGSTVEHLAETTRSLYKVIQATHFIDARYSISVDVKFVATTHSIQNEPIRMISTPVVRMVSHSDFVQLTGFQQFFMDACTDDHGVINERGFSRLVNHVAHNYQWQTTDEEQRLSIFAVDLSFEFHPRDNDDELYFEALSSDDSVFDFDENE